MNKLLAKPLLVLLGCFALATGQEIGTEICACSPRSYEFTLDFSLTCPPVNITLGDAVAATSCLVSPFGETNVNDFVPVAVEGIDILEMGQNLQVIAQTRIEDALVDGDTFLYTSLVADPNSVKEVQEVPRALQLNIVGTNKDGARIINVFIVTFTNECGSYPLFQEGQSAGWARFTGLGPGSPELCSAIESSATGSAPTTSPPVTTDAPTDSPVAPPTEAPVEATPEPTKAPVFSGPTPFPMQRLTPTLAPTKETTDLTDSSSGIQFEEEVPVVTDSPTVGPTVAPVVEETDAPVEVETMEPTKAPVDPTEAPVDPTEAPVAPTEAPVDPTEAPVETEKEVEEEVEDPIEEPVDQDDDFNFPDIEDDYGEYVSMSMSMSMSMSLTRLLSESHTTKLEFGVRMPLRNLGIGAESDEPAVDESDESAEDGPAGNIEGPVEDETTVEESAEDESAEDEPAENESDTTATKSDKKGKKDKDSKSDKKAKKDKDSKSDKASKSDKKEKSKKSKSVKSVSLKSEKASKSDKESKKSKVESKKSKDEKSASMKSEKASKSDKESKKSKEESKKSKDEKSASMKSEKASKSDKDSGPEKGTKPNPTASKSDKKASKSEKEGSKKSKGSEKSKLEKSVKSPKRLRELETTPEDINTGSNGFSRLRVSAGAGSN